MIVVDASVAVKWYVLEAQTPEALSLLADQGGDIAVSDIFLSEVIGVLVRRANIDRRLRTQSEESISRLVALFDEKLIVLHHLSPAQTAAAASIALDLGHPLKDCLYLQLARHLDCSLVTADARFADRAAAAWPKLRLLGGQH